MSKAVKYYQSMASAMGFCFDEKHMVLSGKRDGFEVMIYAENKSMPHLLTIQTSAMNPTGVMLSQQELQDYTDGQKIIPGIKSEGNSFKANILNERDMKQANARMAYAVNTLVAFLRERGYVPCCSMCGKEADASTYIANGRYYQLCPECAVNMQGQFAAQNLQNPPKKENLVGGIVGAILGSLLGVLCIVILSRMGYVASVSGVVMAVGVLKGYELLGGRLSKRGIVISVIVMLVMTYVGDRLDWAITLKNEVGSRYSIFECYRVIPGLVAQGGSEFVSTYVGNLLLIYVFVLLGAIPTIRSRAKREEEEGKLMRIG